MTDWNKSKVVDLKAELKKRGLPSSGVKAELVARLDEADAGGGPLAEEIQDDNNAEVASTGDDATPTITPAHATQDTEPFLIDTSIPEQENQQPSLSLDQQPPANFATPPITPTIASGAPFASPVTVEAQPIDAPTISHQASIEPQEVQKDLHKRKRRSQSPPPSAVDTSRKRMRADEDLPFTNVNGQDHEDETVSKTISSDQAILEPEDTVTAVDGDIDIMNAIPDSQISANEAEKMEVDEVTRGHNGIEKASGSAAQPTVHEGTGSALDPKAFASDGTEEVKDDHTTSMDVDSVVLQDFTASKNKDTRFKELFDPATNHASGLDRIDDYEATDRESDRTVEPAIHAATSALYIRNFQRPLNVPALRQHLNLLAAPPSSETSPEAVVDIFVDAIRSHALVEFMNISAASRVRSELHGRVWPNERNRQDLWVDFIPPEKVEEWVTEEQSSGSGRGNSKKWEIVFEQSDDNNGIVARLQEATSVPAARRASNVPPVGPAAIPAGPRSNLAFEPPSGPRSSFQNGVGGRDASFSARAEPFPPRGAPPPANLSLDERVRLTDALPVLHYQMVKKALADKRLDSMDRAVTKGRYDKGSKEINRYTFEDGDVLVDRGPEIFAGIRPPPRGGRVGGGGYRGGSYGGGRGEGNWRGRGGGDRYGGDRHSGIRGYGGGGGRRGSRDDYDRNDRFGDRRY